jgi:hypothetical protein
LFNNGTSMALSSATIWYKHRIISAAGFSTWQGPYNNWTPVDVVSSLGILDAVVTVQGANKKGEQA